MSLDICALAAAGIRGMDMLVTQNRAQSSINIMLKGQAFLVSNEPAPP
jgi:hypothetical protein